MWIPNTFRYDPKNHCWPAIWKSIASIMVFSLLLVAIEAPLVYEIKKALSLALGYVILVLVIAVINSLLLRRYVVILVKRHPWEHGEPRFACHMIIWLFSMSSIIGTNEIEHDARAEMFRSETLDGLKFDEAEYFYIESPLQIDTARCALSIKYNNHPTSRGLYTKHCYKGCYAAPFRCNSEVFYIVEFEYSRNTSNCPIPSKYTKDEIWENFQKEFCEVCRGIKSTVNNHLFQLLPHESGANYWRAIDDIYLRDTTYYGINTSSRAYALKPVEHDMMPSVTDHLPTVFFVIVIYFLFLLLDFGFSKTVPFGYWWLY